MQRGGASTAGPYQFTANKWHHFVVTKSGALFKCYLNGIVVLQANVSSSPFDSNGNLPLLVVASNGGITQIASSVSRSFNGDIDDILFTDHALSDEEVEWLLNASAPTSQPSGQPTGQPTSGPTGQPAGIPSQQPVSAPTSQPSGQPTEQPTSDPTSQPTGAPSQQPVSAPSIQPSAQPTEQPASSPSVQPTAVP